MPLYLTRLFQIRPKIVNRTTIQILPTLWLHSHLFGSWRPSFPEMMLHDKSGNRSRSMFPTLFPRYLTFICISSFFDLDPPGNIARELRERSLWRRRPRLLVDVVKVYNAQGIWDSSRCLYYARGMFITSLSLDFRFHVIAANAWIRFRRRSQLLAQSILRLPCQGESESQ